MRNGLNATEGQELYFYRIRKLPIKEAKEAFNELRRSIEKEVSKPQASELLLEVKKSNDVLSDVEFEERLKDKEDMEKEN